MLAEDAPAPSPLIVARPVSTLARRVMDKLSPANDQPAALVFLTSAVPSAMVSSNTDSPAKCRPVAIVCPVMFETVASSAKASL